jgi:hypothetical protein
MRDPQDASGSVLSDEFTDEGDDSSYGPTPPPPKHRHPKDIMEIATAESYEVEQDTFAFDDDDQDDQDTYDHSTDVEKADPPADTEQDESGAEDIDFEEDQSVEIPPTTVVQKMLMRENTPKEGGSKFILYAGIAACCLLIIVIVLSAGYGSGAFKNETSRSESSADSETTTIAPTGTTGGTDVPRVPVPAPIPMGTPTPSPTVATTDAPVTAAQLSRAGAMRQYLATVNIGGAESLTDGAENRALAWLVSDDPLVLDPTLANDQQRIRQRYALLNIWFNSVNQWNNETGWTIIEDECAGWFGVTCDDSQVVITIDLEDNNVQGILPADIALLSGLVTLNLDGNVIEGELPASLATLPNLEVLFLGINFFVQDLSAYDFSGLTSLTVMDLSNNGFSGNIPDSIWSLTTLKFLVLDENEFSGELSGSISQLSSLSKYSFLLVAEKNSLRLFRLWSHSFFCFCLLSCSHSAFHGGQQRTQRSSS